MIFEKQGKKKMLSRKSRSQFPKPYKRHFFLLLVREEKVVVIGKPDCFLNFWSMWRTFVIKKRKSDKKLPLFVVYWCCFSLLRTWFSNNEKLRLEMDHQPQMKCFTEIIFRQANQLTSLNSPLSLLVTIQQKRDI